MGAARVDISAPCAFAALFWLLLSANVFAAEPSSAPEYDVPEECPARQLWLEQLHARLPSSLARRAEPGLAVHIERQPGLAGRVEYRGVIGPESGGDGTDRVVRGASCREVFDALILVAALSIDGQPQAAPDRGAPEGNRTPENQAALSAPVADEAPRLDVVPTASDPDVAPERSADTPRFRWGALGMALLQTGIAPSPSLDVGAGLVASGPWAGLEPWLFLGVYASSARQTVRVQGAVARLEHWAVRGLGCPWRYPLAGWVALRPCIGIDIGQSRGEGSGASGASSENAPWLSVRGELRLESSLFDAVRLGAAAGAALPLLRPRFYFEPGAVAFHAAPLGLEANVFAAVLF